VDQPQVRQPRHWLRAGAGFGQSERGQIQVGRLSKLAATNPELRAPISNLLKSLANDNAVPSIAASSNPDGGQNQQ
jgi:hypothetical protein